MKTKLSATLIRMVAIVIIALGLVGTYRYGLASVGVMAAGALLWFAGLGAEVVSQLQHIRHHLWELRQLPARAAAQSESQPEAQAWPMPAARQALPARVWCAACNAMLTEAEKAEAELTQCLECEHCRAARVAASYAQG